MIAVTGNRTVIVFVIHGGGYDDDDGRDGAGFDPCFGVAVWSKRSQTFFSKKAYYKLSCLSRIPLMPITRR